MMLNVDNLTCGYKGQKVIEDISFTMNSSEILCILGPNGVGKTTFYKTMLGFIPSIGGKVSIEGKVIKDYSRKELAKLIAYVPQASQITFGFSVREVLLMGRHAYSSAFRKPGREDEALVESVIKQLGIEKLADKNYNKISGGEQQLVLIARAIVQGAALLVMDEPTANLDYGNQMKVLNVISQLRDEGKSIIMTTHSPDHALISGTRVIIFYNGGVEHYENPKQIINEELIRRVYDIPMNVSLSVS